MGNCIIDTCIQLQFLGPDGKPFLVTVPADSDAEDLALIIRNYLRERGVVLDTIHIDHEIRREG